MKVNEAISLFQYDQKNNLKLRTIKSYEYLLCRFQAIYAERSIESISADEILQFLEDLTLNDAKSTRRLRYSQIKAFFNIIISLKISSGNNWKLSRLNLDNLIQTVTMKDLTLDISSHKG
jgi:site-specific recombinase XerD